MTVEWVETWDGEPAVFVKDGPNMISVYTRGMLLARIELAEHALETWRERLALLDEASPGGAGSQ